MRQHRVERPERIGRRAPSLPNLLIQTRDGQLAANPAMFGRGWPG
ncbi:hypothetical protein ACFVZJ_13995 [Streptomyces sp. NPDC058322]